MRRVLIPAVFLLFLWLLSCQKDNISYSPSLNISFSSDTVLFDTVFTTIGSATRHLKVYNNNQSDVEISSIRLAGGESSPYRINVDGEPITHARDVLLRSKDSLFVFVEVNVNPTSQNAPMLIADSLVFNTNGNVQDVKLVSWGQDVHLLNSVGLTGANVFTADKPYLIYNYLYVAEDGNLKIEEGARLHFHNQAQLIVDGTLEVDGAPENAVVFQGDRLEEFYRDKAGQWGGLWFRAGSHSSSMNWAEVKNAILGVVVDTFAIPDSPTLTMHNTRVENMSAIGLYARGAIVEAGNCLFANAGQTAVALTMGGKYRFYQSTIANYWGQYTNRKGPALLLNNYYTYKDTITENTMLETRDLEEAYFVNCIIYGSRDSELEVDNTYQGQVVDAQMNYLFENSFLKAGQGFDLSNEDYFVDVFNENPLFKEPFENNYELDTLSPAMDIGLYEVAAQFPVDLNNVSRLDDDGPDLGAFERVEIE